MNEQIIYGNWFGIWVCSTCNQQLSTSQKMYNNGVCPFYGIKKGITIVEYKTISIRAMYVRRKVCFGLISYLKKVGYEEKDGDRSKDT